MTEDRGVQMKTKAKRQRSSTNLCHHIFVNEDNPITIVLRNPDSSFLYEGLALQDYDNKAPDDKLAIVSCLGIEALQFLLPYLCGEISVLEID